MTFTQQLRQDLSLSFWSVLGFFLIFSVQHVFAGGPTPAADLCARAVVIVGISWWLTSDARKSGLFLPMNYGLMFIFFTPLFLPFYLIETRGWKGLLTLIVYVMGFTGICAATLILEYTFLL